MTPYEIILKKRNGEQLSSEEIGYLIQRYTGGFIPDYQMVVLLMAIYFQGMTPDETAAFKISADSAKTGEIILGIVDSKGERRWED